MTRKLRSYEHHVLQTREDMKGYAWCGVYVGNPPSQFVFTDIDHLAFSNLHGSAVMACPKCRRMILYAIRWHAADIPPRKYTP